MGVELVVDGVFPDTVEEQHCREANESRGQPRTLGDVFEFVVVSFQPQLCVPIRFGFPGVHELSSRCIR